MKKTIVILGAGEGISFEVAKIFLSEGFEVVLVSRNLKRLEKYRTRLSEDKVKIYDADLSDETQLNTVIGNILEDNDSIDVVLYNAANIAADTIFDVSFKGLIEDFKVNVAPLVTIVQGFNTKLSETKGALLITGGGIGINPNPEYVSLSLGKAALRNLTWSIKETLSKDGIFVATLLVNSYVNSKVSLHNPKNIANTFWNLYVDRTVNEIIL